MKRRNKQTIVHMTQHRKIKNKQYELHPTETYTQYLLQQNSYHVHILVVSLLPFFSYDLYTVISLCMQGIICVPMTYTCVCVIKSFAKGCLIGNHTNHIISFYISCSDFGGFRFLILHFSANTLWCKAFLQILFFNLIYVLQYT